jgi:hypothetical protein
MRNLVVVVVVVCCSQENLVEIATLEVGNQTISVGLNASFDTLLFYNYLPSAVYTPFVNAVSLLLAALILGSSSRSWVAVLTWKLQTLLLLLLVCKLLAMILQRSPSA